MYGHNIGGDGKRGDVVVKNKMSIVKEIVLFDGTKYYAGEK